MMCAVSRRGFTLVEVTIALVLASALALMGHQIFAAGIASAKALAEAHHALSQAGTAHRFLSAAFLSMEVGEDGKSFEGRPDRVQFSSWLETPDGWFEPVPVELALNGGRLSAHIGTRSLLVLVDSVAAVRFDYLLDYGTDERWIREWVSPLSAPIAVRLHVYRQTLTSGLTGDTTLYIVKARG